MVFFDRIKKRLKKKKNKKKKDRGAVQDRAVEHLDRGGHLFGRGVCDDACAFALAFEHLGPGCLDTPPGAVEVVLQLAGLFGPFKGL